MNLATGPFDMILLNYGGWLEFLETSGRTLAFIILCAVGSILMVRGLMKNHEQLIVLGLASGGFAIPVRMIDWNVFSVVTAIISFSILFVVVMAYSSTSATQECEKQSGEGHAPTEGHKPMRVVEAAQPNSSSRDQSSDSAT